MALDMNFQGGLNKASTSKRAKAPGEGEGGGGDPGTLRYSS